MALVTYVLGDCPGCGEKDSFGNVDVRGTYVSRGCKSCRHSSRYDLPKLKKKILYLDQFFFSHAFRGRDQRFIDAAKRISRMAALQLLVVPYSSIHEDETHQWAERDALFKFIKATARGHEFVPAYDVERLQLVKAFKKWLASESDEYQLEDREALEDDVHTWDGYFRIDVGRYIGDIDLIRDLKKQSTEGLVDLFDDWRKATTTFREDQEAEHEVAGRGYMDSYLEYAGRMAIGDLDAMLYSPIISTVVQSMLTVMHGDVPIEDRLKKCAQFFVSCHFKQAPYQQLSARIFATLKAMVKDGAYKNRKRTLQKFSGFFYDVRHIATYAPYCDAFVMDQAMADLISKPTVGLERDFSVKVFSLNNWDAFLAWLKELEGSMSEEHKAGLATAYPK